MLLASSTILRRTVLLGTPLLLATLELSHPNPADVTGIGPQVDWWITIQLIQLPIFDCWVSLSTC